MDYSHFSSGTFTPAKLSRFLTLSTQPWREYCPWRPDDMPPKRGNPAALAKLQAELGEEGEHGGSDGN